MSGLKKLPDPISSMYALGLYPFLFLLSSCGVLVAILEILVLLTIQNILCLFVCLLNKITQNFDVFSISEKSVYDGAALF